MVDLLALKEEWDLLNGTISNLTIYNSYFMKDENVAEITLLKNSPDQQVKKHYLLILEVKRFMLTEM